MSGTPRFVTLYGVHPSGTSIQRSGSSREIFLTASANLIRNREFHVDYLGHAQRLLILRRADSVSPSRDGSQSENRGLIHGDCPKNGCDQRRPRSTSGHPSPLEGVRDPDRIPPPLPRAELGIHGLNRWTVN